MTRRRRTTILVEGSPELRRRLADEVRSTHRVVDIAPPEAGLTMIKMRETAKRTLFYLGELLITEAKVRVEGKVGLGLIAGDDPESAVDLAVIDAAYNGSLPITHGWQDALAREESRLKAVRSKDHTQLLETRVRFETMDTEINDD